MVLLAGGRNKGLDLPVLAARADRIRAVVAIGEAADEVVAAFDGLRPVRRATSMAEAVRRAAALAEPGDTVLLSPACASFDWYRGYAARGDDFTREVAALLGGDDTRDDSRTRWPVPAEPNRRPEGGRQARRARAPKTAPRPPGPAAGR